MKSLVEDTSRLTRQRLIRFGVVGISNTFVGYITFALVLLFTRSTWAAVILSTVTGVINSFIWNSRWTFGDMPVRRKTITVLKFLSVYLVTMLVNEFLLKLAIAAGFAALVSQVPVLAFSTVLSYIGHRYWSFREIHPFRRLWRK